VYDDGRRTMLKTEWVVGKGDRTAQHNLNVAFPFAVGRGHAKRSLIVIASNVSKTGGIRKLLL
jgi:hypothetical protein